MPLRQLPEETNWLSLWKELAIAQRSQKEDGESFANRERAKEFEAGSRRKSREKKNVFLEFVKQDLKPFETVLDIGGGTGRLAIPLAKVAKKVTVVEPAKAMSDILLEKAREEGLKNISIVQKTWEEAEVEPHDIAICAHAMYGSTDFTVLSARWRNLLEEGAIFHYVLSRQMASWLRFRAMFTAIPMTARTLSSPITPFTLWVSLPAFLLKRTPSNGQALT